MPRRPARPCNHIGCPVLVYEGRYCERHKKERQAQQDKHRGSAASRGYDSNWRKIRDMVLRSEPLCRRCKEAGVIKTADVVHHQDGNQYNNKRINLEPLCKRCHDQHTAREQAFGRKG